MNIFMNKYRTTTTFFFKIKYKFNIQWKYVV